MLGVDPFGIHPNIYYITEKVPIFAKIVPRKGITVPSRALPIRVRLVLLGFVYSLRMCHTAHPFLIFADARRQSDCPHMHKAEKASVLFPSLGILFFVIDPSDLFFERLGHSASVQPRDKELPENKSNDECQQKSYDDSDLHLILP